MLHRCRKSYEKIELVFFSLNSTYNTSCHFSAVISFRVLTLCTGRKTTNSENHRLADMRKIISTYLLNTQFRPSAMFYSRLSLLWCVFYLYYFMLMWVRSDIMRLLDMQYFNIVRIGYSHVMHSVYTVWSLLHSDWL